MDWNYRYKRRSSRFSKRLTELTPPAFRVDTPHNRFTADLHRLNSYFWSSEIAYAATLTSYLSYQDSPEAADAVLSDTCANAFIKTTARGRPHYHARMGSLLVQLRWNYDSLGRYAIVESVSIAEAFVSQCLQGLFGPKVPSSFERIFESLRRRGVALDAMAVFRAQVFKLLRNSLVHDRSTMFDFPPPEVKQAVRQLHERAIGWSSAPEWPESLSSASREILVSTRVVAEALDLAQLFVAAIYCLSTIREFGDSLERDVPIGASIVQPNQPLHPDSAPPSR